MHAPESASDTSSAQAQQACVSCGSPYARAWATPQGPAQLCPTCATMHGLGCP
ncbi:MAG: hypothetical protein Q8M22_09460 [Actinomycetota bacterium]|nr:hypothetical protein [Actinomycetota bacterium]